MAYHGASYFSVSGDCTPTSKAAENRGQAVCVLTWLTCFPRDPFPIHTFNASRCWTSFAIHIVRLPISPNFCTSLSLLLTLVMSSSSNDASKKPARTRERKPRGRGLRTRTGCLTCRKRHLKCNEARPICGPCTRSNHSCVYADPSAPYLDSTSTSSSSSASKQTPTTHTVSNSATPSVATNLDLDYSDSSEGFDLAPQDFLEP